jgi:hypothetical protein
VFNALLEKVGKYEKERKEGRKSERRRFKSLEIGTLGPSEYKAGNTV